MKACEEVRLGASPGVCECAQKGIAGIRDLPLPRALTRPQEASDRRQQLLQHYGQLESRGQVETMSRHQATDS